MNQSRLESLLDDYQNHNLGDEQRAELERLLMSSPEARQQFWERARFHALLSHWGQQEWGRRLATAPKPETASWTGGLRKWFSSVREWSHPGWGWAMGAIGAICLAVAATLVMRDHAIHENAPEQAEFAPDYHSEDPAGVAVLTRSAFVQWLDPTNAPSTGAALAPGWVSFKSGAIQVEFSSGARVIVEGPAELEIVSAKAAFLKSGRLSAFVPPSARGFEVRSPQLALVDFGTEFGMAVPRTGPAEAHVFDGKVEVGGTDGKAARQALTEGQAVRVQGGSVEPIPAQPGAFLREDQLATRELDWEAKRYAQWKQAAHAISADPATLVHYTFEDQPSWQRVVRNQATNAAATTLGSIVGCDWVEGRWRGKGALEFKGRAERVKLEVPGQFKALTCFAWVRVDALPHFQQSLFMTEHEHAGAVHWCLTRTGEVRIASVPWQTNGPAAWHSLNTPSITPDDYGHWVFLASVVDGPRFANYVNGQLVGKGTRRVVPVELGRIELGNWGATGQTPGMEWAAAKPAWFWNRGFKGRMDEFALMARALTPDEIRKLYEQGRLGSEPVMAAESN